MIEKGQKELLVAGVRCATATSIGGEAMEYTEKKSSTTLYCEIDECLLQELKEKIERLEKLEERIKAIEEIEKRRENDLK